MCDQTTTKIVYALQAQANEDMIVQQREATIAAALALPEADRYRLWLELDEQFNPRSKTKWRRKRRGWKLNTKKSWMISCHWHATFTVRK